MDNEKLKQIMKQKPSAYRSMQIARLRGYSGNNNNKNKNDLNRWILEKWVNLNALIKGYNLPCGKKYPGQTTPTVCRPSIKIDEKKTPTPLASNLTNKQIQKAIKIKQTGKRINWKDL
jgi:hypothetical protein